jgi:hypothetical protein
VIGKNGKERNTTVADARQMGLYPSVTSVLGIMDKPQLTAWKIEQAIMSSLTLPKEADETLETYARRVVKDSKESTTKAAEHGTKMHTEMENILLGRAVSRDETLARTSKPLRSGPMQTLRKPTGAKRVLSAQAMREGVMPTLSYGVLVTLSST